MSYPYATIDVMEKKKLVVEDSLSRQDVMFVARLALVEAGFTVRSGVSVGAGKLSTKADLAVVDPVTDVVLCLVKVHRDKDEYYRWIGTFQHAKYKALPVPFLRFRSNSVKLDHRFVERVGLLVDKAVAVSACGGLG